MKHSYTKIGKNILFMTANDPNWVLTTCISSIVHFLRDNDAPYKKNKECLHNSERDGSSRFQMMEEKPFRPRRSIEVAVILASVKSKLHIEHIEFRVKLEVLEHDLEVSRHFLRTTN